VSGADSKKLVVSGTTPESTSRRTSQRSLSANSATGVPLPQLDRTESLVSDNGIPPPSNINYNLPSQDIGEVDQDSPTRKVDQRKSAVSFKEPVITNYHSRADTENWDTPILKSVNILLMESLIQVDELVLVTNWMFVRYFQNQVNLDTF
jgi:hypothetical protein